MFVYKKDVPVLDERTHKIKIMEISSKPRGWKLSIYGHCSVALRKEGIMKNNHTHPILYRQLSMHLEYMCC